MLLEVLNSRKPINLNHVQSLNMVLIATACCQLVSVAGKPSNSRQSSRMGQFSFYKMGLDARPIYANSKKEYLFFSSRGYWVVSWKA